jgi:small subunit ribosomal protein S9
MSKNQYFYAVGKRKTAIARVRLHENGTGEITVNTLPIKQYFQKMQLEKIHSPLSLSNHKQTFDITVHVEGGGKDSQSEAVRHGITRALVLYDATLRPTLKKVGYLRRDSRIRERKKPGLKRARRAPQWAKR